jgi:hypothetical protein
MNKQFHKITPPPGPAEAGEEVKDPAQMRE